MIGWMMVRSFVVARFVAKKAKQPEARSRKPQIQASKLRSIQAPIQQQRHRRRNNHRRPHAPPCCREPYKRSFQGLQHEASAVKPLLRHRLLLSTSASLTNPFTRELRSSKLSFLVLRESTELHPTMSPTLHSSSLVCCRLSMRRMALLMLRNTLFLEDTH
jgi:hypothetical protein